MVDTVAQQLGPLLDELTLVGGCTAGLLITDPAAARVRPTLDVDLVVEAATYVQYEVFGKRLERAGFQRSTRPGDPICRWVHEDLVLDVMPLDERVLGFSNRWYASALGSRLSRRLPSGTVVNHIDGPHFVATKLEAFVSRGEGDYLASHDLEDTILVIDGRPAIESEIATASRELRSFVGAGIERCLADRYFIEAIPGFYPERIEGARRSKLVVERLRRIVRSSQEGESA